MTPPWRNACTPKMTCARLPPRPCGECGRGLRRLPVYQRTRRSSGLPRSTKPPRTSFGVAVQPAGSLAPGQQVELDFQPFEILKVYAAPQEHGWAHTAEYAQLSAPYLLAGENPPRRIRLQLASPTTFKSGGKHIPLPLPELVFGSLLEKWNAFAPVALPDETRRYAAECLTVTQHRLQSEVVTLKEGSTRSGTRGEVTFTTLNYDRYWMSVLHTLTTFARFCGLGISASMGMGQARGV